jgi:hypothetical protein
MLLNSKSIILILNFLSSIVFTAFKSLWTTCLFWWGQLRTVIHWKNKHFDYFPQAFCFWQLTHAKFHLEDIRSQ